MAKINKVSRQIAYHKVLITILDPDCMFSIKPQMQYMKVFKASAAKQAIRAAARYCNQYMLAYPGTSFAYSAQQVEPYNYYEHISQREE